MPRGYRFTRGQESPVFGALAASAQAQAQYHDTHDDVATIGFPDGPITLRGPGGSAPVLALGLAFAPSTRTIEQGATGDETATITRPAGFTGAVTVTLSGLPGGVTYPPTTLAPGETVRAITITVSGGAAIGTSTISGTVSAAGVTSATATFALQITAPPPSGTNGPGQMLTYPTSTEALPFTPPTGIDANGNGTVYPTDAVRAAAPTVWHDVETEYAGDLQAAINACPLGEGLKLANRTVKTYVGNFTLPDKAGTGYCWLASASMVKLLTGVGSVTAFPRGPNERVTNLHADYMACVETPGGASTAGGTPAFRTGSAIAHHYVLSGLEIRFNPANTYIKHPTFGGGSGLGQEVVRLEYEDDTTATASTYPHHFIFDRCWIHGNANQNSKRALWVRAKYVAVLDSRLDDIHADGAENCGIGAYDYAQFIKVVNSRVEAGSQWMLFGGADPWVLNDETVQPGDVEVRHSYFFRPLSWNRYHSSWVGVQWNVKCGLESKNMRRWLIEGCKLQNMWPHAQPGGFCFLFGALSDNSRNHRMVDVVDIHVRHCWLDYVSGGISTSVGFVYPYTGFHIKVTPGSPATIRTVARNATTGAEIDPAPTGAPYKHNLINGDKILIAFNASLNGLTGASSTTEYTVTVVDEYTATLNGTTFGGTFAYGNLDGTASTHTPRYGPLLTHKGRRNSYDNILVTRMGIDTAATQSPGVGWMGPASSVPYPFFPNGDITSMRFTRITIARSTSGYLRGPQIASMTAGQAPAAPSGLVFQNIVMPQASFGWFSSSGIGKAGMDVCFGPNNYTWRGNIIYQNLDGASGVSDVVYPNTPPGSSTTKVNDTAGVGFVNAAAEDWRMTAGSVGATSGVDASGALGSPSGYNDVLLAAYISGVAD